MTNREIRKALVREYITRYQAAETMGDSELTFYYHRQIRHIQHVGFIHLPTWAKLDAINFGIVPKGHFG